MWSFKSMAVSFKLKQSLHVAIVKKYIIIISEFLAPYFQDAFLQKSPVSKQPWWLAMSTHTHLSENLYLKRYRSALSKSPGAVRGIEGAG